MKIKQYVPPRASAAVAALMILLVLLRIGAAVARQGDPGFRARTLSMQDEDEITLRGRVVRAPVLRTRATAGLTIEVDSARFRPDEPWQPVSQEPLGLQIYTRGRKGAKGEIRLDQPALTSPDAYGYEVQVRTRSRPQERGRGRPLCVRAYWKDVEVLQTTSGRPAMETLLAAKSRLLHEYRRRFPDPVYRLAAGAILGDRGPAKTGLYRGQPIGELFTRAGIGHVLVVSGLHVGVLAAGVAMALRCLNVPKRGWIAPMTLVLGAYLLLTGARPATARATVMADVAIIVCAFRRRPGPSSVWVSLAVSAAVLLAWQPTLLLDPGFQLSYGAVLSLLVLTRPVGRALTRLHAPALLACLVCLVLTSIAIACYPQTLWSLHGLFAVLAGWRGLFRLADIVHRRFPLPAWISFDRLPRPVRSLVAAQFAIQLGMVIPLGSLYFGQFSIAGTVVNLFAIPLIAVFVQAGILTGVLGMIPVLGAVLAWLPQAVTNAAGFLFFRIADVGAKLLPCPSVPRPSALLLCVWYAAVAAIFFGREFRFRALAHRFLPLHGPIPNPQPQEVQP